jgi:hypothetical protein
MRKSTKMKNIKESVFLTFVKWEQARGEVVAVCRPKCSFTRRLSRFTADMVEQRIVGLGNCGINMDFEKSLLVRMEKRQEKIPVFIHGSGYCDESGDFEPGRPSFAYFGDKDN